MLNMAPASTQDVQDRLALPAYVINLARSPERRAHMVGQLEKTGVPYEIVTAVEARNLDLSDRNLVVPHVLDRTSFRPGAVGCALSHLLVYQTVLERGFERALVLEDDVLLPPDLGELTGAIADEMSGAEVVLLNFHGSGRVQLSKATSREVPSSRVLAYPVRLDGLTSAAAYMITAEACARMAEVALPVRAHPDDWEFFVRQKVLDRARCVFPMPVTNSPNFRTTIDYYKPGSLQLRVRERVSRVKVPPLQRALVARRLRRYDKLWWTGTAEFVDLPSMTVPERSPLVR
jgi:glycosyl transferase family 25